MKKLYLLLLVAFVGFIGNAQFSYPSAYICSTSPSVMPVFAPNTSTGGTFSSFSGLMINSVTGEINPIASTPGAYSVTYSVPAGLPDFIAFSYTTVVQIVAPVIPTFNIPAFCYGSNPPALPTVSLEGISGTWIVTQTNVMNSTVVSYTFTPYDNQCGVGITRNIVVVQPISGFITTESGSDTVYVDENNVIVASLTLVNEITSDEFTYQWYEDGSLILNATAGTYTISTVSANAEDRVFTVKMTDTATGCSSMSNGFVVNQSSGVAPPEGLLSQTLPSGSTLANLVVSGTEIQWYASATNKNNTILALPLDTVLVDNTTYYASQTVNSIESVERLPVTAHLVLGIGENELATVSYFPNPVKNSLTIKALDTIVSTSIVNMLGQVLKTTKHNQAEVIEIMGEFSRGTYFIKVCSGNKTQVLKIVKQ